MDRASASTARFCSSLRRPTLPTHPRQTSGIRNQESIRNNNKATELKQLHAAPANVRGLGVRARDPEDEEAWESLLLAATTEEDDDLFFLPLSGEAGGGSSPRARKAMSTGDDDAAIRRTQTHRDLPWAIRTGRRSDCEWLTDLHNIET